MVIVESQVKLPEGRVSNVSIAEEESESMLQQWENMHRPPGPHQVIPPSGPGQSGLLVPTHAKERRSSVISPSKGKAGNRLNLGARKEEKDSRRPSEFWKGRTSLFWMLNIIWS